MKLTTKTITTTAALLAICIISQIFKNISVFITGPIINACIIIAVLSGGLISGAILSVVTPVTSFFITGSPIIAAVPAIIPFIMVGNLILACGVWILNIKKSSNLRIILGEGIGSVIKALFMTLTISYGVLPACLPAPMIAKVLPVAQNTFSVAQLITALIGSTYAFIIWIPLRKIYKEQ